jgi:hypothetical protein
MKHALGERLAHNNLRVHQSSAHASYRTPIRVITRQAMLPAVVMRNPLLPAYCWMGLSLLTMCKMSAIMRSTENDASVGHASMPILPCLTLMKTERNRRRRKMTISAAASFAVSVHESMMDSRWEIRLTVQLTDRIYADYRTFRGKAERYLIPRQRLVQRLEVTLALCICRRQSSELQRIARLSRNWQVCGCLS